MCSFAELHRESINFSPGNLHINSRTSIVISIHSTALNTTHIITGAEYGIREYDPDIPHSLFLGEGSAENRPPWH